MMRYMWIIVISSLFLTASAYSIQGDWLSTNYNNSKASISAVSTGPNGLNNYKIQIDGCTSNPSFAISQSYMIMGNLGKPLCKNNSDSANSLLSNLQQKFFYFQIYYDQLLLVNIYGNKSLSFMRNKVDMRNYNLQGVFKFDNGDDVLITNQSIYLCNNSLKVDYLGNSKDSVSIKNQTINGVCQNNNSNLFVDNLQQAEYYRLQNPNILRFYDSNYSPVLEINKQRKWDGVTPTLQTTKIEENLTKSISNDPNYYQIYTDETVVQGNADEQGIPRSRTRSGANIQSSNKNQSNPKPQDNDNTSKNTNPSSSQTPNNQQMIKLTFSLAAAIWYPSFFPTGNPSEWPSRLAINATNIAFIGCNTITIPMVINYNDGSVKVGNNRVSSRRQCGQKDQPYVNAIKNASRTSATANHSAFTLTFYDKDNKTLFSISRNYTAAQKQNFIYDATNPVTTSTIIPPNNPVKTQTAPKATNTTIGKVDSTVTKPASNTNVNAPLGPPGPPGPPISPVVPKPVQSKPTPSNSNPKPSESVTSKTPSPPTISLVGKYNPSNIGRTPLPNALTRNIFFVINPTIISLSGTCNSYKYTYQTAQNGTLSQIMIDTESKLVQQNPQCDNSNDQLFVRPFQRSKSYNIASNSVNTTLNLFDNSGVPTISLTKKNASPPS